MQVTYSYADFPYFEIYIPRSRNTLSYSRFMFSFLRKFHTVFHNVCVNFHSHQHYIMAHFYLYPHQHFFNNSHSNWSEVICHCGLYLHSHDGEWSWACFHVTAGLLCFTLSKTSILALHPLPYWIVCFDVITEFPNSVYILEHILLKCVAYKYSLPLFILFSLC